MGPIKKCVAILALLPLLGDADPEARQMAAFALGLIDPDSLAPSKNSTYVEKFEHEKGQFEGGSSGQSAPIAAGSCAGQSVESPGNHRPKPASNAQQVKITAQAGTSDASYRNGKSYPPSSLAASSNGNGKGVHHGA